MTSLIINARDFALPLAQLMLPNTIAPNSEWYVKGNAKLAVKQEALAAWLLETGFQPFPFPDRIVLVKGAGEKDIPPGLLTAWHALRECFPVQIIAASEKIEKGKVVWSGSSIQLESKSLENWMGAPLPKGVLPTEELTELQEDDLVVHTHAVSSWYGAWLAEQLDALSLDQVAGLVSIMSDAAREEDTYNFLFSKDNATYSIDLAERSVSTRNVERSALAKCSVHGATVTSRVLLTTLLIHLSRTRFNGSVDDVLNRLPNVWEREPNYGVVWEPDHRTRVMTEDSRLKLSFSRNDKGATLSVWPFVLPKNAPHGSEQIDSVVTEEQDALPDKYNIKWLRGSEGSKAAGMGSVWIDGVLYKRSIHEQKESKAYSRPCQANPVSIAMAEVVRADGSIGTRERSLFRIDMGKGQEAAQYGVRLRTLYTNASSVFGMSSGEAGIHPDTQLRVKVQKTKMLVVNFDGLPVGVRDRLKDGGSKSVGMANLTELLTEQLNGLIDDGHVFYDGDEVLGLHEEGVNHSFMVHQGVNQPMTVHSHKTMVKPKGFQVFESEEVRIKVVFTLAITDSFWKLRNDGIKFTTMPLACNFYDEAGAAVDINWELLLPMESVKGRLHSLVGYAYDQGGAVVDVAKGELTTESGKKLDLLEPYNGVYDWLKTKVKSVWVEFQMAQAEYDVLVQARGVHDDLIVVSQHEGYVMLRELIQVLEMDALYEVELSSPREKSASSQMTLEMLSSMTMQSPKLGESLNAESLDYRKGVQSLVQMIQGKPASLGAIDVTSPVGRQVLAEAVGQIQHLEGKQIVKAYEKAYPQGLVVKARNSSGAFLSVYFDFGVVLGMSTFIGKVGDGISNDIVAFLSYVNNPGESGSDNNLYSKLSSLKVGMDAWLLKSMQSNKIMKRMARTKPGSMHTLVVRTAVYPELNHEPGELPKLAINPDDQILEELAQGIREEGVARLLLFMQQYECLLHLNGPRAGVAFNFELLTGLMLKQVSGIMDQFKSGPASMNGAFIGCGRTPMVMLGGFQLIVTDKVSVGHAALLPHIWAMLCEGDADGDTINVLSLTKYGLDKGECLALNTSVLGMNGYKIAYGKNPSGWPCAEFSSHADKWGKKALVFELGSKAEGKYLMPYVYTQPMSTYLAGAQLVAGHYKGPVGISYNVCVVMTHRTLDLFYAIRQNGAKWDAATLKAKQDKLNLWQMSMAIAWRLLYEGLGLAGYSPAAKEFFSLLHIATYQETYTYVQTDGKWVASWIERNKKPTLVRNCLEDLIYLGNHRDVRSSELEFTGSGGLEHLGALAKSVVRELVACNRIAQDAGAIVKGKPRVAKMERNDRFKAILYFSLRHAGRGADPAGLAEMEARNQANADEVIPASLINACIVENAYKMHGCPWIQQLLIQACNVHMSATDIQYAVDHAEQPQQ